jgi:hypothetical protein
MLLAFPSPAAPTLLVHQAASREQGVCWQDVAPVSVQVPVGDLPTVKKVFTEATSPADLAPGAVLVAHRHRVHSVLWSGWGSVLFSLAGAVPHTWKDVLAEKKVQACDVPFDDSYVASWVQHAAAPKMYSGRDTELELEELRRDFSTALALERELYAGLAREEVQVRQDLEAARLRITNLERSLHQAAEGHRVLLIENGDLRSKGIELERSIAAFTAELQSARLQHQALFSELQRLQVECEEAKGKVLTFSVVAEGLQRDLAEQLKRNAKLQLRERDLEDKVTVLSVKTCELERAILDLRRHSHDLEDRVRDSQRSWLSRITGWFTAGRA